MRVQLQFSGSGSSVLLLAETDAEQAILGFLAEASPRWNAEPNFSYRPGGIQQLLLVREHPMVKKLEDLQKRDERARPA